jgi:hypothetical protein
VIVVARTVLEAFPEAPASTRETVEPEIGFLPPTNEPRSLNCGLPGLGDEAEPVEELKVTLLQPVSTLKATRHCSQYDLS